MEDSGAILAQISSLKDMLDQVNEEIEANIQVTREIESAIVKCSETETAFAARESELTKIVHLLLFEINDLVTLTVDSRASLNSLEDELRCLKINRNETHERMNEKREDFMRQCLEFQNDIHIKGKSEAETFLKEKEAIEIEIYQFDKKISALRNSVLAFVDEILEDLHSSNSALEGEILRGNWENEKLLGDINDLKTTLLSTMGADDYQILKRLFVWRRFHDRLKSMKLLHIIDGFCSIQLSIRI